MPATVTVPAGSRANPAGTSIREAVRTTPLRSQPRLTQYGSYAAKVVTSRSTSHLVAEV